MRCQWNLNFVNTYGKVMFSVMSVCLSFCSQTEGRGSHVAITHNALSFTIEPHQCKTVVSLCTSHSLSCTGFSFLKLVQLVPHYAWNPQRTHPRPSFKLFTECSFSPFYYTKLTTFTLSNIHTLWHSHFMTIHTLRQFTLYDIHTLWHWHYDIHTLS